jgi:hypothetical protein
VIQIVDNESSVFKKAEEKDGIKHAESKPPFFSGRFRHYSADAIIEKCGIPDKSKIERIHPAIEKIRGGKKPHNPEPGGSQRHKNCKGYCKKDNKNPGIKEHKTYLLF